MTQDNNMPDEIYVSPLMREIALPTALGKHVHRDWTKYTRAELAQDGWRPIESAPKDGTMVDLYDTKYRRRITDCSYSAYRNDWKSNGEIIFMKNVNYWQPLPPPPAQYEGEKE